MLPQRSRLRAGERGVLLGDAAGTPRPALQSRRCRLRPILPSSVPHRPYCVPTLGVENSHSRALSLALTLPQVGHPTPPSPPFLRTQGQDCIIIPSCWGCLFLEACPTEGLSWVAVFSLHPLMVSPLCVPVSEFPLLRKKKSYYIEVHSNDLILPL